MKLLRLAVCFVSFCSLALAQAPAPKAAAPDPSLPPVSDVPGLPRVLLLGDSISMGYTLPVRARLAGKANVHRPAENCAETAHGVERLDAWLGDGQWAVVHFNFGLHDLKYVNAAGKMTLEKGTQVASIATYEKNLRTLVARLKLTGAKLVFATTTPVPAGSAGRVEHDERLYNAAARRVMKDLGVPVDDLHAVVEPQQEKIQLPHNVHFTPAGYEQLANAVTASIVAVLPAAK